MRKGLTGLLPYLLKYCLVCSSRVCNTGVIVSNAAIAEPDLASRNSKIPLMIAGTDSSILRRNLMQHVINVNMK